MSPPIVNRQSPIDNPEDWLPIDEAAELTGLTVRHWRRLAATLFQRSLARQAAPRSGRGKPIWWIHRVAHAQLSRCPDRQTRSERVRAALLERYPEQHVQRAYRKLYWLNEWRRRCSFPRTAAVTERAIAAEVAEEAKKIEGPEFRIGVRSLQIWSAAVSVLAPDGQVRGVEALVSRYAGPTKETRSPEAVEFLYALYHTQSKHDMQKCHEATLDEAHLRGWHWPESYRATTRWLHDHDDLATSCLHREGPGAYSHRHMSYIEIDKSSLQPGELYEADHMQCDFWAAGEDGRLFRPWLTSILDCRSRLVVGWHLGPAPHQDAIVTAMRRAFSDRAIPRKFHMDQGKDFTSALITGFTKNEHRAWRRELGPQWREAVRTQYDVMWRGILGELGIEIIQAIAYQPWSKGQTERSFRTMHSVFCQSFVTYCGRSSDDKPECAETIRRDYAKWQQGDKPSFTAGSDVPTLERARLEFADALEVYHHNEHRGQGMDGRSPLAVWATATHLRKAQDKELLSLMQARGVYRVGANGVRFKIGADVQGYGALSSRLRSYRGRDVFITLDPQECSSCFAYTFDRSKFIAKLDSNERIPYGTDVDDLREVIAQISRQRKDMRRAKVDAPHRMRTASQILITKRARKAEQLRKTGTDNVDISPNIQPVRTGFEAVSTPVPTRPSESSGETSDALQRLAEFTRRSETAEPADGGSVWSRLQSFNEKGGDDD